MRLRLAAIADGSTEATDVAEALVRKGVAFREAYKATGQLVAIAHNEGFPLAKSPLDRAKTVHPKFDADVLAVLDPTKAQRSTSPNESRRSRASKT